MIMRQTTKKASNAHCNGGWLWYKDVTDLLIIAMHKKLLTGVFTPARNNLYPYVANALEFFLNVFSEFTEIIGKQVWMECEC